MLADRLWPRGMHANEFRSIKKKIGVATIWNMKAIKRTVTKDMLVT